MYIIFKDGLLNLEEMNNITYNENNNVIDPNKMYCKNCK